MNKILSHGSQHFPISKNLTVFDGGYGAGRIALEIAKEGHYVTGIDLHKNSLNVAERNAK